MHGLIISLSVLHFGQSVLEAILQGRLGWERGRFDLIKGRDKLAEARGGRGVLQEDFATGTDAAHVWTDGAA